MPELLSVGIDQLMPDPTQPRKTFEADALQRLAASLAARGVLQPLRVLWDAEREAWLIVTGESRWRAAKLAGIQELPCIPMDGQPEEADLLADRIVENSLRNDLRPLEFARALAKLKALRGLNSQALARELGISGAAITRAESLLTLPDDVQTLVDSGSVAESTAYEISRLPDEVAMRELAGSVAAGRMNRQAVAEAVQRTVGKKHVTPKASRLSCRLDGGLSVTMSAGGPLTWESLLEGLDRLRKEARKLYDAGKEPAALAHVLRAS
jgi:ParB family transcriptional regulator, chromosome partitioning protein